MLTCLEFSNKTYKHQVIFGLSRNDIFLQKVILAATLSLYVVILSFGTILASGLIYSYKITTFLVFERSWILLSTFLQTFTWLMTGVLFALLFRNMILSVILFGFYRVILEPVIRNLVSDEASWFFPTKFITKLTPEPQVLKIVEQKMKSMEQASPDELAQFNQFIPDGVPYLQNLALSLIFLAILLVSIRYLYHKKHLN